MLYTFLKSVCLRWVAEIRNLKPSSCIRRAGRRRCTESKREKERKRRNETSKLSSERNRQRERKKENEGESERGRLCQDRSTAAVKTGRPWGIMRTILASLSAVNLRTARWRAAAAKSYPGRDRTGDREGRSSKIIHPAYLCRRIGRSILMV